MHLNDIIELLLTFYSKKSCGSCCFIFFKKGVLLLETHNELFMGGMLWWLDPFLNNPAGREWGTDEMLIERARC